MPSRRHVVLLSGLPAQALQRHMEPRPADLILTLHGPGRNVTLDLDQLAERLAVRLPAWLQDLLEIAVTVHAADIALPRGANEDWVRNGSYIIPVREVDLWRSVEPSLTHLLYAMSHDAYVFHFERREPEQAPPAPGHGGSTPHREVDCVSLLSGGIDSFAGATMLLATGPRPLFVAHRPYNPAVATAQEHVTRCLARRFGGEAPFLPVACGPGRSAETDYPYPPPEARETSQRTRSFLFLALGAAACYAVGSPVLYCPENGVLALNLPLTEARIGGYSTAGTRPRTLDLFAELLTSLGLRLRLDNPFLYQTKGQLVRDILKPHFSAQEIQGAVSCWMAGRTSRPCGGCIPCLVRAIAMHTARLPREACAIDPLGSGGAFGPESAARANLVDLMALVHRFRTLGDQDLLRAYPTLLGVAPEASIRAAATLMRRFAEEAHQALTMDGDAP